MPTVVISKEDLHKVLADVETLVEDVTAIFDQDAVARKRLAELEKTPRIAKSEKDLDAYLKRKGVAVK